MDNKKHSKKHTSRKLRKIRRKLNKLYPKYKEKLSEIIIAKRQELEHRQNRLNNNIFAGICKKSIIAQRKTIFYLEIQIESLEYKLQHNL